MYTYHVYGKIYKEQYYFASNHISNTYGWMFSERWDNISYLIHIESTSNEIFNRIKLNNGNFPWLEEKWIDIDIYINKWQPILLKKHNFTGKYKEVAIIETDIELRDNETIHIEGKSYKVKYVFNSDANQHELYINKNVEIIVDEKLLKHAKKVCNEVIKKILRYNKEVEQQKLLNKNNNTEKESDDIKEVKRGGIKKVKEKLYLLISKINKK